MFNWVFGTIEQRCLIHGLRILLKHANNDKEGRLTNSYNDKYWNIMITRKK